MTTTSQKPTTLLEAVPTSLAHAARYNAGDVVEPAAGVLSWKPVNKWANGEARNPTAPEPSTRGSGVGMRRPKTSWAARPSTVTGGMTAIT